MKNSPLNHKIVRRFSTLYKKLELRRISPLLKYAPKRFSSCEGSEDHDADLAILGAGPAGMNAAIRARENGIPKVIVIDKFPMVGGNCINYGCIPSKCLLNFTNSYYQITSGLFARQGIITGEPKVDLKKMMQTKFDVMDYLNKHVKQVFDSLGIKLIRGVGRLGGCNKIIVDGVDSKNHIVKAHSIMLATGSDPRPFPGLEIDEKQIVTSEGVLDLKKIPKRLVVVGAGIIGLELGSAWSKLGSKVFVITDDNLIGVSKIDEFMRRQYQTILEKQGLKFILNSKVLAVAKCGDVVKCQFQKLGGHKTCEIDCDVLMVCIGRVPHTEGLCLERVGIEVDKWGFIPVCQNYQTNIPNYFAVGDVIQGPMTAHKAIEDGIICVDFICGKPTCNIDWNNVPLVIYTDPELASVGKSEEQLNEECIPYYVKVTSFQGSARAKTDLDTSGYAKALICRTTNQVLGTHLICAHAGELINEACVIQQFNLPASCIARTIHAHPTYSKIFKTIYSV